MKSRIWTILIHATALALAACAPSFSQDIQQTKNSDDAVRCQLSGPIPVTLAPAEAGRYTVSGQLCATRNELSEGTTVQLLIHGATYNRDYWDFGKIDGVEYSYARDMAASGFATFALNEIGA